MSRDDYRDYQPDSFSERADSEGRRVTGAYSSGSRMDGTYPGEDHIGFRYAGSLGGDTRDSSGRRPAADRAVRTGPRGSATKSIASSPSRPRPRRSSRSVGITIVCLGLTAFAVGFLVMWSLGSVIVGGAPFGNGSSANAALSLPSHSSTEVQPLVDLIAFRDLAYIPVKGVAVMPNRRSDYYDRVIAAIDRTEINSLVITVKDDFGHIAFDSDMSLGKKYGTINSSPLVGIQDLDGFLAKLAEHHIMPIARIVSFKDDLLARKRPEMAVHNETGGVFVDGEGQGWLNPYNHDAWEYLVEVAEECAHRGFREIQFDYVRFPTAGTSKATYPGQYCAKEDCIAGFLAYARPRLEALGVWMSADCFGWVVGRTDDVGMGQKLEKLCQNVDVLCPMVYPSLYGPWSYGVEAPELKPYDIVHAALGDAAKRLVGTGAKGRPYLLAANGKRVKSTAGWMKAQIQAAEDLGFNEWILWGGYIEEGLRSSDGSYSGPTGYVYSKTTTTTLGSQ